MFSRKKEVASVKLEKIYSKGKAVAVLKKQPLFQGLFDAEISFLTQYCGLKTWKKNEIIFKENDVARSLFVVLEGKIEVASRKKGVLALLQEGGILGELGIITSKKRVASATAKTNQTITLEIQKVDLDFLLGQHPRISFILMRNMALELAGRFIKL